MTLNMGKTLLLNGTISDASLKIYQIVSILIPNTSIHIWRDPKCSFLLQLSLCCRPPQGAARSSFRINNSRLILIYVRKFEHADIKINMLLLDFSHFH